MTHGKTYNKSPRRINHKATKSKKTPEFDNKEHSSSFKLLKSFGYLKSVVFKPESLSRIVQTTESQTIEKQKHQVRLQIKLTRFQIASTQLYVCITGFDSRTREKNQYLKNKCCYKLLNFSRLDHMTS